MISSMQQGSNIKEQRLRISDHILYENKGRKKCKI